MKKSQPKPKPAVKKYTASDSVAYERMMDRQFSDSKLISKGSSKQANDAIVRSSNRQDSMVANPYYKQNYETAIKNFKKKVKSGAEKATKPSVSKTKPVPKTKMKMEITRLPDTVVKKPVSKLERAKKMFPKMKKKK